MDQDDRYTRITLRIPKDLHSRLAQVADETSKSLNAEIIARLQESVLREVTPDTLVPASKAREIAGAIRKDIATEVRATVISQLSSAIKQGLDSVTVDLTRFSVLEYESEASDEVTRGIAAELEGAGYSISWDGPDSLTISFSTD